MVKVKKKKKKKNASKKRKKMVLPACVERGEAEDDLTVWQ